MDKIKKQLTGARDILINIAKNPKNKKFQKLPNLEYYRAKRFREENIKSTPKFHKYKRGSIIFVDFGIGIGQEFSLPHFAIVLDNKDHPSKGTLTVIPLTSKFHKGYVDLGRNLIEELIQTTIADRLAQIKLIHDFMYLNDVSKQTGETLFQPKDEQTKTMFERFVKRHSDSLRVNSNQVTQWLQRDREFVVQISDFYKKYNKNTYANPNSVTTISKLRIMKPLNPLDPIGRTILQQDAMDILEREILKAITRVPIDK